jgi:hypothetical protein
MQKKIKYEDLIKKFKDYCEPRKTVMLERFKFWQRRQQADETIDQFVTELRNTYARTEYQDESLLRDQFVFGIRNQGARAKLLQEDVAKLTLTKTIDYCRTREATEKEAREMETTQQATRTKTIAALRPKMKHNPGKQKQQKPPFRSNDKPEDHTFLCRNCGTRHGKR